MRVVMCAGIGVNYISKVQLLKSDGGLNARFFKNGKPKMRFYMGLILIYR